MPDEDPFLRATNKVHIQCMIFVLTFSLCNPISINYIIYLLVDPDTWLDGVGFGVDEPKVFVGDLRCFFGPADFEGVLTK